MMIFSDSRDSLILEWAFSDSRVGVFPHVTGLPLRGFSTQICLFSRLGFIGFVKNRFKSGFLEVINSSGTSVCSII